MNYLNINKEKDARKSYDELTDEDNELDSCFDEAIAMGMKLKDELKQAENEYKNSV